MITNQDASMALNALSQRAYDNAEDHGFHEDQRRVSRNGLPAGTGEWFHSTVERARLALLHSEVSEWVEEVRKGCRDYSDKPGLEKFLKVELEAADVVIRALEACAMRGYRIGEAVVAKMEYNRGRPCKHGKNS